MAIKRHCKISKTAPLELLSSEFLSVIELVPAVYFVLVWTRA
jgi:hypothetical protein